MQKIILSIFLSTILISCIDRNQQSTSNFTKMSDLRRELMNLEQIRDSLKKEDSLIDINIDTSKTKISISQIKGLFQDTGVSIETFPWITNIYRCPVKRIIAGKLYESYLNIVFCRDALNINQIDSFSMKMIFVEKTLSTSFENFYGGKNAIIFHNFYISRVENRAYSDTLSSIVKAGLIKCGYRRYNPYLLRFY